MISQRSLKLIVSVLLVLIVIIMPTAAVSHAENAARPMQTHDFTDVPVAGQEFMEPFIDEFYHQGITGGCSTSPLQYCPGNPVTRGAMAVFMGRALGYVEAETDGFNARAYFKQTDLSSDAIGVVGRVENGIGGVFLSDYGSGLRAEGGIDSVHDNFYDIELGGSIGEVFANHLHLTGQGDVNIWLDEGNNSLAIFRIYNGETFPVFVVDESGNTTATGTVSGTSANSYGIFAESTNGTALYAGSSPTNAATDTLFDIELGGTIGELFGSVLHLFSNRDFTFDLDNDDNTGNAGFFIRNGDNTNVFTVDESGNMTATGTKSAIVSTMSYGDRKLYAVESPENWFEDFGAAELVDGELVIEIDPMFVETVNLSEEYHVYVTPMGGWAELYVAEQTATSFTVRATDPNSTASFHYRIVAKRLGYEDVRMEEVNP